MTEQEEMQLTKFQKQEQGHQQQRLQRRRQKQR